MKKLTYKEFIDNILKTRGRFACGEEYHERHHIMPKCMGGGDEKENLIDLFAKEHFMAHKLLASENLDNESLIYAWWCMSTMKSKHTKERYEISAEEYEEVKKAYANIMSDKMSGDGNPFYGKQHTDDVKKILSELRSIPIVQLDMSGNFIAEYKNAIYASNETSADYSSILKCCASIEHCNSACGYLWMYKTDYENGKIKEYKNNHLRPVVQLHKNGDFIAEYSSVKNASKATNTHESSIIMCCNNIYQTAGDFLWKYKEDYNPSVQIIYTDTRKRPVIQFDIFGNIIKRYESIKDAEQKTGIYSSNIIRCCLHDVNMAGSFVWRYADEEYDIEEIKNKKYRKMPQDGSVLQFDVNMNFIAEHKNVADAVRNTGVSKSSISRCCRGEQEKAGGYIWIRKYNWDKLQTTIQNELEDIDEL